MKEFHMLYPLVECYQVFDFITCSDYRNINYVDHLGTITKYNLSEPWHLFRKKNTNVPILKSLVDLQMFLIVDPLRIARAYMRLMNPDDYHFWGTFKCRIISVMYEPIIKYLLLKTHIDAVYFVNDIVGLIMIKYFEAEYERIHKIMGVC